MKMRIPLFSMRAAQQPSSRCFPNEFFLFFCSIRSWCFFCSTITKNEFKDILNLPILNIFEYYFEFQFLGFSPKRVYLSPPGVADPRFIPRTARGLGRRVRPQAPPPDGPTRPLPPPAPGHPGTGPLVGSSSLPVRRWECAGHRCGGCWGFLHQLLSRLFLKGAVIPPPL